MYWVYRSSSMVTTACLLFHRFYSRCSYSEYHHYDIAATSLFVSCKVVDQRLKLSNLTYCCAAVGLVRSKNSEREKNDKEAQGSADTNNAENSAKDNTSGENTYPLRNNDLEVAKSRWTLRILKLEPFFLEMICFDFEIPTPNQIIPKLCKLLDLSERCCSVALAFANDSLYSNVSLLYVPEIISAASIFLAIRFERHNYTTSGDNLNNKNDAEDSCVSPFRSGSKYIEIENPYSDLSLSKIASLVSSNKSPLSSGFVESRHVEMDLISSIEECINEILDLYSLLMA
ncbi:hypothetical protein BB560_003707 [Smittium megazygosporum]|uniref:Uncharacterized protein n=1 Tax=Smittium megazygosporum TaxID=133381 RepID=A0A2T9ZBB0_9FUNG|nr:hypothetical protein BB560_003707 [Smittium megazygosporum]